MEMLAVRNYFSIREYIFPANLAKSVYFHLLCQCHYFSYLVLVVFKFNCILRNRYFTKTYVEAYETLSS